MVSPYRAGEPPKALSCPRCNRKLPPMDVAQCEKGCGTWVSQFAASVVLTETDRRPDPVTRWWRVRAPCPLCSEKMKLFGDDPALLQGCELHGYFVDADTVKSTGLSRGVDIAALESKRSDTETVDAERAALEESRLREEQRKQDIQRREAEVGARIDNMTREEALGDERHTRYLGLITTGSSPMVANYVLDLEARVRRLEQRLEQLDRTLKPFRPES